VISSPPCFCIYKELTRPRQSLTRSDQSNTERNGGSPRDLIAEPASTFQSFTHLVEGGAIDLPACITAAQDLQRVRFIRCVYGGVGSPAPASPAEPVECAPAEECHNPYPEQWQQWPESESPKHVDPLFLILWHFHTLIQQTPQKLLFRRPRSLKPLKRRCKPLASAIGSGDYLGLYP
jgi:hypothetical protein